MSEEIVSQILQHINREVEHYRLLLNIVEQERDALLGRKHDMLLEISEQKLHVAEELVSMQKERRAMMEGLPGKPAKLSDLATQLPGAAQTTFKTALGKARDLATRLAQISESNKRYLEEALDTVEHLISIFTGNGGPSNSYGRRGKMPSGPPRFLAREV